jgi:hypothetical protein
MSANDTQISGNHYKGKTVQPWDYIAANNLGYFEGNVVRYISRWRDKGGVDDLRKAKHYIEKLIELETQVKDEYKSERLILPTDDGPLWITWDGDPCPVDAETKVEVMLISGQVLNGTADEFFWTDAVPSRRVCRYRVIKDESKTIHGFIPWTGGEQPVTYDANVELVFKNGKKAKSVAGHICWNYEDLPEYAHIIGYRVIK